MPEIQYFTVRQIREVRVQANSVTDAAQLAQAAFTHGQFQSEASIAAGKKPEGIWGDTISRIKELQLEVTRDR